MVWNDIFGLALAAAGAALFLSASLRGFGPGTRHPEAAKEAPEGQPAPPPDELAQRLARRVQHAHRRRRRQAQWGVGLIVAACLVWIVPAVPRGPALGPSPPLSQGSPPAPAPAPPAATPPSASPPATGSEHLALWAIAAPGIAAMLVGGAMLVASRSTWVRAAGTATLLSGLSANGYLIKELKVSEIFKLEAKIDKPTLDIELNKRLQHLSEFGPRQLALFEGFAPGEEALLPHMDAARDGACQRWQQGGEQDRRGLLLVVGSTDRVALGPAARRRYESNIGLARARAEQVKQALTACGIPPEQLMTLVSGPRKTPTHEGAASSRPDPGFPEDRSVVVWALWSVPVRPGR